MQQQLACLYRINQLKFNYTLCTQNVYLSRHVIGSIKKPATFTRAVTQSDFGSDREKKPRKSNGFHVRVK